MRTNRGGRSALRSYDRNGFFTLVLAFSVICSTVQAQRAGKPAEDPVSVHLARPSGLFRAGEAVSITGVVRVVEAYLPVTGTVTKRAFTAVAAGSDAANIEVLEPTGPIDFTQAGRTSFVLAISVKADGEYEVSIALASSGRESVQAVLSVLARDGKMTVSPIGFRDCEWQLLMEAHSLPVTSRVSDVPSVMQQEITLEFQRIMRNRDKAMKEWKRRHQPQTQGSSGQTTGVYRTKNDRLVFRAFWTARDDSGADRQLSIVGAKVDVFETNQTTRITGGTLTLEGPYADNLDSGGIFEFDDPGKDFYVRVIPDFDGDPVFKFLWWTWTDFDPFEVVDINRASYEYWADKNSLRYEAGYGANKNLDLEGGVWAAYHGTHAAVLGAMTQHNIAKGQRFECVSPNDVNPDHDDETYQSGNDIFIGWNHCYEWDVVAHELSHAIDDDNNITSGSPGGGHYLWENAYSSTHNENNTQHNKRDSLALSISEAYANWFGVHLTHRSPYAGYVAAAGDTLDRGIIDLETPTSYHPETRGEDAELAVQRLLWDISDTAPGFPDETISVAGIEVRDSTGIGFGALLNAMKEKNLDGFDDLWRGLFLPGWSTSFLGEESAVSSWGFDDEAEQAAELLVAHGMSPILTSPASGARVDLDNLNTPVTFKWQANVQSGDADLTMDEFRLVLYSFDYATILFDSGWITSVTKTLSNQERQEIRVNMGQDLTDVKAVVYGRNDHQGVLTGPYASNVANLNLTGYNRYVVMVVDSSGSNTQTDPNDLRKVAAKTTINRLVSAAEAQAQSLTPDLAAAIDFDSSVTILSDFADPPQVEPTIDNVDSSGSTEIDDGINAAVTLIENAQVAGRQALTAGKSMICVFTDGENNAGPDPVIAAIDRAQSKGIRVHYGFLAPLVKGKGAADEPRMPAETTARTKGTYASIEEAVLATGGVYGEIADDVSQLAFVDQMFRAGLTGVDPADQGSIVGQVDIAGRIEDPLKDANFYFAGAKNEAITVTVRGLDIVPEVYLVDKNGRFIAMDKNYDGDLIAEVRVVLPYQGMYNVKVFTKTRTGRFNIFVDVQNPTSGIVEDVTQHTTVTFSNWSINRNTGALVGTMTLRNNTGSPKTLKDAFWYAVPVSADVFLASPDGTTPDGVPYLDITAKVLAALPNIGDGDLNLDPGEEVTISGIEVYSRDRSAPQGYVFALWADPPVEDQPARHRVDRNKDGVIDDFELLESVDLWGQDEFDDFGLLGVIELWRAGGYVWDKALGEFVPVE